MRLVSLEPIMERGVPIRTESWIFSGPGFYSQGSGFCYREIPLAGMFFLPSGPSNGASIQIVSVDTFRSSYLLSPKSFIQAPETPERFEY